MDESLIPLTPEEAGARGVRTKDKAARVNSFLARLDKAMAEPDYEREETFRYLKERRRQTKREQELQRLNEARATMRAEVDSILQEDEGRSQSMSGGAMANSAGAGIEYVENETGKLVKRRASANRRTYTARRTPANVVRIHGVDYVQDETGELVYRVPPAPRRFTAEDLERVNKTRDRRHGHRWWLKRLQAVSEGTETVTREQLSAHMAIGRSKGWTRHPSGQR